MSDRPEQFRYAPSYGTVQAVHPASWEVDVLTANGGLVLQVLVLGPRLPEISTKDRPQWVIIAFPDALQGQPVCWPIESRLPGPRLPRADFVYYDEVLNYRITINRENELEIRNTNGAVLCQLRIQQINGVIRLDTPSTSFVLQESDKSAALRTKGDTTVIAKNADVTVDESATVTAGQDVTMKAGNAINLQATSINLIGAVAITGDLSVDGDVTSTKTIMDATGNTPHHSHG